jgi:predicted MFS family arabinose efflux permease
VAGRTPAASPQNPDAVPVRAVAASIACLTASVMPGFLAGALGSDIKDEFGISDTGLGVTLAVTYALSAVASIHAGELADRIGARRSLLLSMWVTLTGYLAVAVLAQSFGTFLVSMAVAGAGLTLAGPAAKVLVAQHVSAARHGVAFAVHMSAIPLAPLLAGLTVPIVGGTSGWRWAFAGSAVLAAAGMLMLPAEPRQDRLPPVARSTTGRFSHVRLAPLFVLGAAATLASAAVIGAASFFVVNSESAGISESTAGLLLSLASAGVITARILLGVMADRGRTGDIGTVAILLVASAAGYALMAADTPWLYALGGQVAIILGWSWPALMVVALVRMNPHAPGLATSFAIGGLNLGAVLGPGVFGAITDNVSSSAALAAAAVWAFAAAALSLLGRLTRNRAAAD